MLKADAFKFIIENAPLVSIDICLVNKGKLLLGKRNNQPLKNEWFTPGGRIFKNESWQECIRRVASAELGMEGANPREFTLMGVWDHFYPNSAVDDYVSTHYVNLPHYLLPTEAPNLVADRQHTELSWHSLEEVAENGRYHKYVQSYAQWLIDAGVSND